MFIPVILCAFLLTCTEPSLKALLTELHPVRANWYNIGLHLDIPYTTLDCFMQKYVDPLDLMREMLKHWINTSVDPPPTWEAVITALRSPLVNKKNVAAQLESKYCKQAQHTREESNSSTMKVEKSKCTDVTSMTVFGTYRPPSGKRDYI